MATIGGPSNFGLFRNGDFSSGSNANFTFGTFNSTNQFRGVGCIQAVGGSGGSVFSDEFVEVNTSESYQLITYARTIQTGSFNGALAGGFMGFACYDYKYRFLDLAGQGGVGNTTLSRDLTAGDSYAYVNSTASFSKDNNNFFFRYFNVYPETHPDYYKPHYYTRIGMAGGDYLIMYSASIQQMPEGDYRLQFVTTTNVPTTFPSIGYNTPAGTPISNGQAGGTFNYALGSPNYPLTWTRFSTDPFTGESRNSGIPFRYGTKYIRFLVLANFNVSSQVPQDHVWALDKIFFGKVIGNTDYRNIL
jgi:hypothetical protein